MIDLQLEHQQGGENYISVFGSEGTLLIGWKGASYKQDGNARWVTFGAGTTRSDALAEPARELRRASSRARQRPLITPEDALASVQVDRDRLRFDPAEQLAHRWIGRRR